jgi:GT2 family glycosyltransferase/glycosyltransferase involved in cell wall biosynthesis
VGVVVLNWNSAWFTRRCLSSLAATEHPAELLRIVVVDNGSVDGSLEELRAWLDRPGTPSVEVLANGSNLGFAEGCNRAVRHLLAPGPDRVEHVALINNDAWVEPGWLAALLEVMDRHDRCGAVGARLVLEPGFVGVDVRAEGVPITLRSVRWVPEGSEGPGAPRELVDRVRTTGWADDGALEWPARRIWRLPARRRGTVWVPAGVEDGTAELEVLADDGTSTVLRHRAGHERTTLLNGVGTGLNEVGEGYDLGYGEPDPWQTAGGVTTPEDGSVVRGSRSGEVSNDKAGSGEDRRHVGDEVPSEAGAVVDGFCGGAALLRGAALGEVGLFDPWFFAYYEDTDLSWRLRRAGWEIRTAPAAVVHHAFGASGGGGSRLHVFLDRRNWLLTNWRNGDRDQRRRTLGWLRRGTWRLLRANVFGRARRRVPVRWEPLRTWLSATAAALAVRSRTRSDGRPGACPAERVRSRLQPAGGLKAPAPWPGGPLLVYMDVGETLKAGYRAGIQRVVCALAAEMPFADERVELVPIRWCTRNQAFRRLTAEEHGSLRRAGASPPEPPGTSAGRAARDVARTLLGRLGVLGALRWGRERIFGRARRAVEDQLVLDRLEPGSVLFEADAVWNELELDRSTLLGRLRAEGVGVAVFVHDLLPLEQPSWFSSHLREIFDPTVLAQLHHAQLVVCASTATASSVQRMCRTLEIPQPLTAVIPLGAELAGGTGASACDPGTGGACPEGGPWRSARYLLVVGTLEPRKNQQLALEVFDSLREEFDDLQLVLVGRYGWGADVLAGRLRSHPEVGTRVHWLADVHDDDLDRLYREAFVVLIPSRSEGFGLPAVEALGRGVPVIASTGGGVPEAAGDAAELLDPDDAGVWSAAVRAQLEDGAARASALERATAFRPRPWAVAAAAVDDALVDRFTRPHQSPPFLDDPPR